MVPPERQFFIHPKLCTNQRQQSPKPALSLEPARAGCTSAELWLYRANRLSMHLLIWKVPTQGLNSFWNQRQHFLRPLIWAGRCERTESHRAHLGPLQYHHRQMQLWGGGAPAGKQQKVTTKASMPLHNFSHIQSCMTFFHNSSPLREKEQLECAH